MSLRREGRDTISTIEAGGMKSSWMESASGVARTKRRRAKNRGGEDR
jgi:hypothetical protein